MGVGKEIEENREEPRNFDICFCVTAGARAGLLSRGKTGR